METDVFVTSSLGCSLKTRETSKSFACEQEFQNRCRFLADLADLEAVNRRFLYCSHFGFK